VRSKRKSRSCSGFFFTALQRAMPPSSCLQTQNTVPRHGSRIGKKWKPFMFQRVLIPASRIPEEDTLRKILMIGALAFAASAIAETAVAAEFYVVRDTTTKKCTVVDAKPTSTTTTIVDNGVFKTKTEAETGMKTMKVCTTN
jgi:hypothetical protein